MHNYTNIYAKHSCILCTSAYTMQKYNTCIHPCANNIGVGLIDWSSGYWSDYGFCLALGALESRQSGDWSYKVQIAYILFNAHTWLHTCTDVLQEWFEDLL